MNFLLFVCVGLAAIALGGVLYATGPSLKDALLRVTRALPASTTAMTSSAIDTGKTTTLAAQPGNIEILVSAPAVTQAQLPDSKTFTYDIIHSDNADLSSPSTLHSAIITQTGSTGAAAATARRRIPSDAKRYLGLKVTPSGSGTGDASAATATMEVVV